MIPITVTAHLVNGLVMGDPWSPSLDGILAYAVMRERLGPDEMRLQATRTSDLTPVEGVPLGVERCSGLWWYRCSSPRVAEDALRHVSHVHRRFDDHEERHLDPNTKRVMTSAGPYKSTRLAEVRVVTPYVSWQALGDSTEVRRLLATIPAVGRGLARGHGVVERWDVRDGADEDAVRFDRPLPIEFARAHGVSGQEMVWGFVPPARAPTCNTMCVLPARGHAATIGS